MGDGRRWPDREVGGPLRRDRVPAPIEVGRATGATHVAQMIWYGPRHGTHWRVLKRILACMTLSLVSFPAAAGSVFTSRPDDSAAVYVDPPRPQAAASVDESDLLQAALDRAGAGPNGGI